MIPFFIFHAKFKVKVRGQGQSIPEMGLVAFPNFDPKTLDYENNAPGTGPGIILAFDRRNLEDHFEFWRGHLFSPVNAVFGWVLKIKN